MEPSFASWTKLTPGLLPSAEVWEGSWARGQTREEGSRRWCLRYSFSSRDHLYLVMKFVNGGDLLSLLKAAGFLDEAYGAQFLEGRRPARERRRPAQRVPDVAR